MATNPGGPYSVVGNSKSTTAAVTGLSNGRPYYFVVTSISSATELATSDEASAFPMDPSVPVQAAGQLASSHHWGVNFVVNSNALYPFQLEPPAVNLGTLSALNLGRGGYWILDFPQAGSVLSHLPTGASVSLGSGWFEDPTRPWVAANFTVDGIVGPTCALVTNLGQLFPSTQDATFDVDPGDQNWHYLTIVSPVTFGNRRLFDVVVTPRGQQTPAATQTVNDPGSGSVHVLQFLVKGPVTVTVPAGALDGRLQAVFLDPAVAG